MSEHPVPQRRGLTAIDGALALIAILLIVQMWLLTAALESFLAGHREGVLPAAIVSAVLLLACLGLYLFVRGVDREVRRGAAAGTQRLSPGEILERAQGLGLRTPSESAAILRQDRDTH